MHWHETRWPVPQKGCCSRTVCVVWLPARGWHTKLYACTMAPLCKRLLWLQLCHQNGKVHFLCMLCSKACGKGTVKYDDCHTWQHCTCLELTIGTEEFRHLEEQDTPCVYRSTWRWILGLVDTAKQIIHCLQNSRPLTWCGSLCCDLRKYFCTTRIIKT